MISLKSQINKRTALWATALFVSFITFIVYIPALSNGFVNWDDDVYVFENPNIQSIDIRLIKWAFTTPFFSNWHPLTLLSLATDYALWGLNPFGYHLTNVILHAANTFLVFILGVRLIECGLTQNSKLKTQNFSLIPASIAALLFGIHPVHVESVSWVSERKDLLCALFFLPSLLAYVKYVSAKSLKSYVLSLASFIFALMSKPMAVSLPIILLLLDFYPLGRFSKKGIKGLLIEKMPFFGVAILSAILTLWAQGAGEALVSVAASPLPARILVGIRGYVFYLAKTLFPFNLAPFYPYPAGVTPFQLEYAASIVLLALLTFSAIKSVKKEKLFFAVWSYYLITLLPVIGFVQAGAQAAADRYMYLPSISLFVYAGMGASILSDRPPVLLHRRLLLAAALLLFATLGTKTTMQAAVWKDSITLWSREIALFPDSRHTAYNNRGLAYARAGKYDLAMADLNKAIELNLGTDPYYNRGNVYMSLGDYQRAIDDYTFGISIKPEAKLYSNRGNAYRGMGKYQQAISDYDTAISLKPNARHYFNRGYTQNLLGNHGGAVKDYTKAIDLNPKNPDAYYNRGCAYEALGNYSDAMEDYSRAIELNPKNADAYYNRGVIYMKTGDNMRGMQDIKEAERLGLR